MDIAKKIKSYREAAGISKNKLADLSGVSQSYITALEASEKRPTIHTLERLCQPLGITVLQLIGDHPEDLPPDIIRLLEAAKKLSPKEREKLTAFIQSTLERNRES